MRNVFDQYQQPENRLTHALVSTLARDRALLRPFLRWAGATEVPRLQDLHITEQQVPGIAEAGDEDEAAGLPDACIYDEEGWALLIEAKVQATVRLDQLRRHVRTAQRHGYPAPFLLVLSVDGAPGRLPPRTRAAEWRELYGWLRRRTHRSSWAQTLVEYLHAFEAQMIARDYAIRGTLTMFDGLRFDDDHPYNYREGKRLLRLLGDELHKRRKLHKLGVDPKASRRKALTKGRDGVWDYLPLRAARGEDFTHHPHLTFAIHRHDAVATLTIPDKIRGGFRTRLRELGEDGFLELLGRIEAALRPVVRRSKGSRPRIYVVQRHGVTRRTIIEDAHLGADLRALRTGDAGGIRHQPEWFEAIYELLTRKRSNMQFGVQVQFSYDCPRVQSPESVDLFEAAWLAMKPMLDFAADNDR